MQHLLPRFVMPAIVSTVCFGDVQEFETAADWQDAIQGSFVTIDFASYPPGTQLLNQYAPNACIFIDGADTIDSTDSYVNDGIGLAGQGDIVIRFITPMNWIAADFPGILQFELSYDGKALYESEIFGSSGVGFFGGVMSTEAFDEVRCFRPPQLELPTFIDDLHFGPSSVPADLTHDAVVGPADLGELLAQWGMCSLGVVCSADFDDSGSVGPADLAQLLAAWSTDCNKNGEFDHFEIITVGDCNSNGIPDDCDVAAGTSLDCNASNVPDECELDLLQPMYVIDDGESDTQIALTPQLLLYPLVWLNGFTVEKGGETIDRVLAAWGVGPATVCVWTDPNDDGIPHDAVLETLIENVPLTFPLGGPFRTIEIPATYVGEVGERFYVGLMLQHEEGEFPAWLDEDSTAPMQSWIWIDLDLNGAIPMESEFPGHWLIRAGSSFNNDANGNSIPDECD